MGETTFNLWCSQAGLPANGSKIDRTGWDYLVELPFSNSFEPTQLHNPAIECKIQVKATDKEKRKLPIKLSNLRHLITSPLPAFFVFIEFDGKDTAQRAFLVHVDEEIITRTLKRISELNNIGTESDYNKWSLTIYYDLSNQLPELNGNALRKEIERYISNGMLTYSLNKYRHLTSTGFENGIAKLTIKTIGLDKLSDFIDVSLGIRESVEISSIKVTPQRFGIKGKTPLFANNGGLLEIKDVEPTATGTINFQDDTLSPEISLPCNIYYSPLNDMVPKEYVKLRFESYFFNITINPFSGNAQYWFESNKDTKTNLKYLRNLIRLLFLFLSSGKRISARVEINGNTFAKFFINADTEPFPHIKLLETLDAAIKICNYFDFTDELFISLEDISTYASSILQFYSIIDADPDMFYCEYKNQKDDFDTSKSTAIILLILTKIGSRVFGFIVVATGTQKDLNDGLYSLSPDTVKIEKKIISNSNGPINTADLLDAVKLIKEKYSTNHNVIVSIEEQ